MTETLPAFLDDVVERFGERTAIRFEGRSTSYRELGEEARRIARAMIGAGVVPGARVALLMANRPEWVAAAFGVWRAGAVLVPVSTFATPPERDDILRRTEASLLFAQRSLLRRDYLAELLRAAAPPSLARVIVFGLDTPRGGVEPWSALDRLAASAPDAEPRVDPDDDAVIVTTSGTTAEPKAILHAHRAPVLQMRHFADYLRLSPDDRLWTTHPFFWAAGMAVSLGGTLAAGATLVLEESFDAGRALETMERERVTAIRAWPHQERALADHPEAPRRDLRSIAKLNGTSPLAPLLGLDHDRWGTQGGYGLSETFTVVSDLPADAPRELRRDTNGLALPGMEIRIVDPATGAARGPGEEGEIAVRGPRLMRGYLGLPPERCFDPDGFFRTGDSGSLDADGYLRWTGRLTRRIKTGGANVSPLEVEQAVAGFPGIAGAVAIGVPDETLGEIVVLCAVCSGTPPEEETVRAHLRERLASYKVPRRVLFFAEDEVEWTATRKLRPGPMRVAAIRRLG